MHIWRATPLESGPDLVPANVASAMKCPKTTIIGGDLKVKFGNVDVIAE